MSLFPQLSPEFYETDDKYLKEMMEYYYAQSITINQSFWSEADIDTRFEAGDQQMYQDYYGNLPAFRRRQFSFNRIRRVVNMISGYQRRNRKSTVAIPVENADEHTADQFSKTIFWANRRNNVLETISEAFHGALVTGLNLLSVWLDYRSDPVSGDIVVDNVHYNGFLIDPYFRKLDLSDCNFIWRRSWLTHKQCISLLPDHKEDILKLESPGYRDGKFQFMPESYNYGMKNLLAYDEFWYRDFRKQRILMDTQTGETMEWESDNEEALKIFLKAYPQVILSEHEVPTVKLGIVVQGRAMYHGLNPIGIDSYPFVPVIGYYTPQLPYFPWRIQGVVRGLRDAQYLYNRRRLIELDILESQINSGFIYKEDSLVNPDDIFTVYGEGRGLALKQEAQMTDVQKIEAPSVPPSMIQLSELLGREVQEIAGVSDELLGMAEDDQAGILSMLRQGAGLTTLQQLFDNLDYSQKLLGKIFLEVIQKNFTPGKIKRIINEDPSPQFYSKVFGKYDCAIEEGLNTVSQKQLQFNQLLYLRQSGVPVPTKVLLESSTLQNKGELISAIQEEEQQQAQQAQQAQQVQLKEIMARTKLAEARAVADQGLGMERVSRIQENEALAEERKAQANKDDAAAALELIKSAKELRGIDLEQIGQTLSLIQQLSQISQLPRQVQEEGPSMVDRGSTNLAAL